MPLATPNLCQLEGCGATQVESHAHGKKERLLEDHSFIVSTLVFSNN
ncbi:STAS domain-containing protein [Psidium guajava]|nr:STAS domain-containing protein [Psidium guajava]